MERKIPLLFFMGMLVIFIMGCKSAEINNGEEMEMKEGAIQADQGYEQFCKDRTPDNWMNMRPMRDGEFTSEKSCWGCMSDDGLNHYCELSEYKKYLEEGN